MSTEVLAWCWFRCLIFFFSGWSLYLSHVIPFPRVQTKFNICVFAAFAIDFHNLVPGCVGSGQITLRSLVHWQRLWKRWALGIWDPYALLLFLFPKQAWLWDSCSLERKSVRVNRESGSPSPRTGSPRDLGPDPPGCGNLEIWNEQNPKDKNSQNQNPFCRKCSQGLD